MRRRRRGGRNEGDAGVGNVERAENSSRRGIVFTERHRRRASREDALAVVERGATYRVWVLNKNIVLDVSPDNIIKRVDYAAPVFWPLYVILAYKYILFEGVWGLFLAGICWNMLEYARIYQCQIAKTLASSTGI